ncbi:CBO0543 family protein [Metabacillus idriensis]|uniref:CBO0543 family protein n=1 Tax=Metabacillus idriensis TaxID=324768 RepID=UPI00281465E0|nr:CBO0543 family protein [Metabacillus idriensis]MDR0137603.1 CBO0543 family protein [Metabacillus idriensis]
MEKTMIKGLFVLCAVMFPFVIRKPNVKEMLIVFFAKGILSTLIDAYVVNTKRIEYPIRPFPKIFKTNILFDMVFFPLLSVIWVRQSYKDNLPGILLKSLTWSVPMSIAQWYMEKRTRLFKWKKWSVFHTFASVSFTLFTIRALAELVKWADKNAYTYQDY